MFYNNIILNTHTNTFLCVCLIYTITPTIERECLENQKQNFLDLGKFFRSWKISKDLEENFVGNFAKFTPRIIHPSDNSPYGIFQALNNSPLEKSKEFNV